MKYGVGKTWAGTFKKNTHSLYLASRDPRVSWLAKIMIGLVVAYALSPVDLIPDFIPIVGYLDDLLLLPIGFWLAIRMIPNAVWRECQISAQQKVFELPKNRRAGAVIIFVWFLSIAGIAIWVAYLLNTAKNT